MSNRTLAWLFAGLIGGGLLVMMTLLQLMPSHRNSLALVSEACLHRSDQCEAISQKHPWAEPENTISNVGYLIAGIAVIARSLRAGFGSGRLPALAVGISFVLLALCSGYYHATLNDISKAGKGEVCTEPSPEFSQILDIACVYLTMLSMLCFGIDKVLRKTLDVSLLSVLMIAISLVVALAGFWLVPGLISAAAPPSAGDGPNRWFMTGVAIWFVCGLWAAVFASMIRGNAAAWIVWVLCGVMFVFNTGFGTAMKVMFHFDSAFVFVVMVGPMLALLAMNMIIPNGPGGAAWRISFVELGLTLSVFAIGIAVRLGDGNGHPLCKADGWFQAHAIWHLMSALALLLTFDLIEKSGAGSSGSGPALLPAVGSLAGWLSTRSVAVIVFVIVCALVAVTFTLVVLIKVPFGPMSLTVLVPLATSTWIVIATAMEPLGADEQLESLR